MNELDDLTELDDVLGPLRGCAQPAELVGESATVDLMVEAHRTPEEKHMFTSRRARIATLIAAGVLGFGGMAAASPSFGDDKLPVDPSLLVEQDDPSDTDDDVTGDDEVEVLEEVDTGGEADTGDEQGEDQTVEDEQIAPAELEELDTGVLPAESSELVDDGETVFNEEYCEDGNHGKTVSAVARGDADFLAGYAQGNPDADPLTVTDAAHSSCGKNGEAELDDEGEIEEQPEIESEPEIEESEESEVEESEAEKTEKPERPNKGAEGQGNGKSDGKGKSNGNGKRGG